VTGELPASADGHPTPLHLDGVLDRVTDGVFGLDAEWRVTFVNDRARAVVCDATGETVTTEDLVGQSIWDVLPEVRDTTFETECRAAMRTREPVTFETHYDPLDAWLDVRLYPSESGLTVWMHESAEDGHDSRERREAVLREMYDVIADRDATFEEQVDDLLRIGQRILGTAYGTLSRVRGDKYTFEVVRSPGDIKAGDTVDLSATNCERVVLDEETLVLADLAAEAPELTERAGFAEWGISCYLGTPVIVDDEVYGTFCFYDTDPRTETFSDWEVTLVDLMGRWVSVALERELVEERLRQQNARLEEFATMVSHDLRNPLNVADGWLEQARETGDDESLDRVESSHARMREIIDDVLALARAGRAVDDPVSLELGRIAADAWEQVDTDGATLTIDLELDASGDPKRLQQLFENLFRNAVDHGSGEDGAAGLTVRVGSLVGGFYVEDDGVGIPVADRERILESGYTTADDGTGLGLGLVDDIATAHGWSVDVTESESGGARIEFTNVD